ncbi:MAG: hypothetical protein M3Y39_20175 [Chloroflexota bacterium]|nr:hypothetical protein [Chloroflexota bacterium]
MVIDDTTSRVLVDHALTQALTIVFTQQQRIEELEAAMQQHQQSRRGRARSTRLQDMTPAEMRLWLDSRRTALAAHSAFVQAYLDRRTHNGTHTRTDDQYRTFQELAADLLDLLDELSQAAADAEKEEPGS